MSGIRFPVRAAAAGLFLGLLACQPVFVIGLDEWLTLVVVAALLLGPIIFRFVRTLPPKDEKKKRKDK
jgi:hypothetical protein